MAKTKTKQRGQKQTNNDLQNTAHILIKYPVMKREILRRTGHICSLSFVTHMMISA